jgi:hypothetical protein
MGFLNDLSDVADFATSYTNSQEFCFQLLARIFAGFVIDDLGDLDPALRSLRPGRLLGVFAHFRDVKGIAKIFPHMIRTGHNVD